jgi:hypothetical protein
MDENPEMFGEQIPTPNQSASLSVDDIFAQHEQAQILRNLQENITLKNLSYPSIDDYNKAMSAAQNKTSLMDTLKNYIGR